MREVTIAELKLNFDFADIKLPLYPKVNSPAVSGNSEHGYSIRVARPAKGKRNLIVSYDYFKLTRGRIIMKAPRGFNAIYKGTEVVDIEAYIRRQNAMARN